MGYDVFSIVVQAEGPATAADFRFGTLTPHVASVVRWRRRSIEQGSWVVDGISAIALSTILDTVVLSTVILTAESSADL